MGCAALLGGVGKLGRNREDLKIMMRGYEFCKYCFRQILEDVDSA